MTAVGQASGTSHPKFDRARRAALAPSLERLADVLNTVYGVDLAQILPDRRYSTDTQCLVVNRGMSVDDVVAAVSIGHQLDRPTYNAAVFTTSAWFEYGDPFVSHPFYDSAATASWIFNFLPSHPEVFGG